MNKLTSSDGTTIAYDRVGSGPAVILVDGALCYRASGPSGPLAERLAEHFTVYTYDRRGRGDSGDTQPYAVEREVDDLESLVKEAGGSASVYGISSGAALALEAANRGLPIEKLALYEAPFIVDGTHTPRPDDYLATMDGLIAADRRGDAVKLFMRTVGVPAIFITLMRIMPAWSKLKGVEGDHHRQREHEARVAQHGNQHTREEDQPGDERLPILPANAPQPTLVMDGGKSPTWMRNGMRALADVLPNARYRTLNGQTHMLKPDAVAPVLVEFFAS